MAKKSKGAFLIIFFLMSSLLGLSQDYSWLSYDIANNRVQGSNEYLGEGNFANIVLKNYSKEVILMNVKEGTTLFLDNKFYKSYHEDTLAEIILHKKQHSSSKQCYLFTLYHKRGDFHFHPFQKDKVINEKNITYISRIESNQISFFWYGVLFLLALIILLKEKYADVFNFLFKDLLSPWFRSKNVTFSNNKLFLTFTLSLILIAFTITVFYPIMMPQLQLNVVKVSSFFFMTLLFLFVKSVITYSMSSIYDYDIHKTLILSYAKVMVNLSLLAIACCAFSYTFLEGMASFIKVLFIIFLVLAAINQLWCIVNYRRFRKIYLFSYLCTSELIPLLVSIKLLQ